MAYLRNDQRFYRPQDCDIEMSNFFDWLCLAQLHAEIAGWTEFILVQDLFGVLEGEPVSEADILSRVTLTIPVPNWRWDHPGDEVLNETVVAAAMKLHGFVTENIDISVKRRKRRRGKGFDYRIKFKPHVLPAKDVESEDSNN